MSFEVVYKGLTNIHIEGNHQKLSGTEGCGNDYEL